MNAIYSSLDPLLGLKVEPGNLSIWQMCARGLVVFVASLFMFRLAHKRFFAQRNALDVLMTLVIASTLARAINGSAAFFPTLAVGFLLVLVHRALSWAACRYAWAGQLVKGHSSVLVHDGNVFDEALRKHDLSREDLDEDLRIGGVDSPQHVQKATLERNGAISIIRR